MDIDAFILIGGHSTRMGRDKAAVPLGGTPMIEHIARSIREAISPVNVRLVAANEQQLLKLTGLDPFDGFVFDIYPDRGPAGGVHSALANTACEWAFIAACDIPLLSADVIGHLAARIAADIDAVVPVQPDGRQQPLAAFYRTHTVRQRIEELLERARPTPSMRDVLDGLKVGPVKFESVVVIEAEFTNVNSPAELAIADSLFRSTRRGPISDRSEK